MDNSRHNDALKLVKMQEKLSIYLAKKHHSREIDLHRKLSTIHETDQSIEREDESSTGIQNGMKSKTLVQEAFDMEFEMEPKDLLLEKIEGIALALDAHQCGVLYLQEIV